MFIDKLDKDVLLKPLQAVVGVVERKQTMPILSNVLIEHGEKRIYFTATDLEIQITTSVALDEDDATPEAPPAEQQHFEEIEPAQPGAYLDSIVASTTIGAKKLQDILRILPDSSAVSIDIQDNKALLKTNKSRFNLQTLPADDYPKINTTISAIKSVVVPQNALKNLLHSVQFAMAQQDVRYYLNGMLLVMENEFLKAVATDGHRLAFNAVNLGADFEKQDIIVPRKAISELCKLLGDSDAPIRLDFAAQQLKATFSDTILISKIIDGKFPDYKRVIPSHHNHISLNRAFLLQALQRATVVTSSEKVRGVRFVLNTNSLSIMSINSEQEEAQDEMEIDYNGPTAEIGFNVVYLMDALNNLDSETATFSFGDPNASVLITTPDNPELRYVVMPMRI